MMQLLICLCLSAMVLGGSAGQQFEKERRAKSRNLLTIEQIQHYQWLMEGASSTHRSLEFYNQSIKENNARPSHQIFKDPPEKLIREYLKDNVTDIWEVRYVEKADYRPIIGILTQPIPEKDPKKKSQQYVHEINDIFNKWAGSRTIAIPYDLSERGLIHLLGNINGVHLTGGSLDLINDFKDKDGKLHPYYVTAKRIIEFSKMVKDKQDTDFPVLGIGQGLQVISLVQNADNVTTLDNIKCYGQRKVNWIDNVNSHFYADFPESLKKKMEEMDLGLHIHKYSVSMETFENTPGLHNEMIITQTDEINGVKFIDAMEHKVSPIFTLMYHPEFQHFETNLDTDEQMNERDELVLEIAFRHAIRLNRLARQNDFTWTLGPENLLRLAVDRVPVHLSPGVQFGTYIYGQNDI